MSFASAMHFSTLNNGKTQGTKGKCTTSPPFSWVYIVLPAYVAAEAKLITDVCLKHVNHAFAAYKSMMPTLHRTAWMQGN
jgi:hypothetical protein